MLKLVQFDIYVTGKTFLNETVLSIKDPFKTSNNKYDWTPLNYLNVLHYNRTQKQLQHKNILLNKSNFVYHIFIKKPYGKALQIFLTPIPPHRIVSALK